jgi:hypothetical protein
MYEKYATIPIAIKLKCISIPISKFAILALPNVYMHH